MADDAANEVIDALADTVTALEGVQKAYNKSKATEDLPNAFNEVVGRVELVKAILGRVESHVSEHGHDEKSCVEMKAHLQCCEQKAKNVQVLFRKVVPPSTKPRLERYREAARGLGGVTENRVEALMVGLLGDVQSLVARCRVERGGIVTEALGKDQTEELTKAIEELSALPPSLSEDASENSINNWSNGTQNINTGKGTQNNNTGDGQQYIGQTQNFNHNPSKSAEK